MGPQMRRTLVDVSSPDVIVVGAGLIGCAIAHALARDGASVLVLDANAPGSGASQASAGMLCPYIEGTHDEALARLGADSLALYDAFVARVQRDSDLAVPYVRAGTLQVADTDESAAELKAQSERLHARGVPCHFVEGEGRVRDLEPLVVGQRAALLIYTHGAVRIRDLVEALHVASLHHDATFLHAERVARIHPSDGRLAVETHARTFATARVVITAGAWSMQLPVEGRPAIPTHPVRGQLLRLQVPGSNVRRALWGRECYMVPWGDEVLVGATMEDVGFDARATVAGVTQLCAAAQTLAPEMSGASFSEVRVGLRPGSPDGLPFIGESRHTPGLVFATGHFRHGALLAPLTADLVVQVVKGSPAPVPPALAASRFDL
jgi:glycine oxidase